MTTAASKPNTTRKQLTPASLKAQLEALDARKALLEKKLYEKQVIDLINKTNVVSSIKTIKANLPDVKDIMILETIGKCLGLKRLQVTQIPVKPRTTKPKKDDTK